MRELHAVRRTNDLYPSHQIPTEMNLSCKNVETVHKKYNGDIVEGSYLNFKAIFCLSSSELCDKALLLVYFAVKIGKIPHGILKMDETSVKCCVRAHCFRQAPRHDECALTFIIFFSSLIFITSILRGNRRRVLVSPS